MPNKRAQDHVIMQRPVHDSVVVVAFGSGQDALVVVRELDQVHTVSLRVIRVDFVAPLKVI